MTRREIIQTATAAAIAPASIFSPQPASPAIANAAAIPASRLDPVEFAGRLAQWALHVPQLGERIDKMLEDPERALNTEDGVAQLLEAARVCVERCGRQICFNWLIIGDGRYPNGEPWRMWLDEPPPATAAEALPRMARAMRKLTADDLEDVGALADALLAGDHVAARAAHRAGFERAGITIEQW